MENKSHVPNHQPENDRHLATDFFKHFLLGAFYDTERIKKAHRVFHMVPRQDWDCQISVGDDRST